MLNSIGGDARVQNVVIGFKAPVERMEGDDKRESMALLHWKGPTRPQIPRHSW